MINLLTLKELDCSEAKPSEVCKGFNIEHVDEVKIKLSKERKLEPRGYLNETDNWKR